MTAFSLDFESIKRWIRNCLIIVSPVILVFLDQIQAGNVDSKILYATAISCFADLVRRYIKDYSKE